MVIIFYICLKGDIWKNSISLGSKLLGILIEASPKQNITAYAVSENLQKNAIFE